MPVLLLTVRFHDGRYHGRLAYERGGQSWDWPPSPARVFQALVAGAARGREFDPEDAASLHWLESLVDADGQLLAPVLAAPPARQGQGFTSFMPNNDLDKEKGDHRRIGNIRSGKAVKPLLFDSAVPLHYVWTFQDDRVSHAHATRLCAIAERLYQLGRGVDMAWAIGEVLDEEAAQRRLEEHRGQLYRPRSGNRGTILAVPTKGSLTSLIERHEKGAARFSRQGKKTTFSQPPKPRFRQVAYDAPPSRHLYDLVDLAQDAARASWPLHGVVELTLRIRDAAAAKLQDAYAKSKDPELAKRAALVEPVLIGRGAKEADKAARVRITPLPSIGTRHTSPGVRRVLAEIPPDCPLPADDVAWALSGLPVRERHDAETGEVTEQLVLARAADIDMLDHYAIPLEGDGRSAGPQQRHRLWRTITPAALPAARRRIDPAQLRAEQARARRGAPPDPDRPPAAKGGPERADEEARAAGAVTAALRHAGIRARVASVRLQREPFRAKGARAEAFAPAEGAHDAPESLPDARRRFAKERLWHVEITFAEGLVGPLVIGDGRYLGLGLMAPPDPGERRSLDALVLEIAPETRPAVEHRAAVVRALRRALMSRDSERSAGKVSTLFSGHDAGPGPAADGRHRHVYLYAEDIDGDGLLDHLGVIAPWRVDRSWAPRTRAERGDRETLSAVFENVTTDLELVRAGAAGVLKLAPAREPSMEDPAFATSRVWVSRTPYRPTRHPKRRADTEAFVVADVLEELRRRGLPRPEVEVLPPAPGMHGALTAKLKLRFAAAVSGPILLGRDAHAGGGMFVALQESSR